MCVMLMSKVAEGSRCIQGSQNKYNNVNILPLVMIAIQVPKA